MKKLKPNLSLPSILIVLLIIMALTNPTAAQFKSLMRAQKSLKLEFAALLPMERTNYILFSRFDIKYGIGKTTCFGAARFIFVCPSKDKVDKAK